ncbi:ABC transporter ATP-binding protein [Candidatus Riflebacteria bacterium]
MEILLKLEDVYKSYRNLATFRTQEVLKGINLEIKRGEVYGFLGNNGSGKTTTIKTILGLINFDSGSINIFGKEISEAPMERLGFAQERSAFYHHLTAREILQFNGELLGMSYEAITDNSEKLLDRLKLLPRADDLVLTFSKGMRQRLGIATSLIHDPEFVILDEPATGLDPFGHQLVREIILEQKELGKTVFFSSHHLEDVENVCDRFGILVDGRMKVELEPRELEGMKKEGGEKYKNLEDYFLDLQKEEEHLDE